jgi:hypothetical protein
MAMSTVLMKIAGWLMILLLIIIAFYLVAEALWVRTQGRVFEAVHRWGVSDGIWVKQSALFAILGLAIAVGICSLHERIKSRRAQKELPESEEKQDDGIHT